MAITRRSLAETYADQDLIIQAAQDVKREATQAYRQQLDGIGMGKDAIKSEIEGFKLAYRRKVAVEKKGSDEVEHRDAIADEIFLEITAPRATRVTRVEIIEEFDPETGEITEPQSAPQAAQTVTAHEPVATSPVESDPVEISTPIQPETVGQSEPDDAAVTAGDVLREPATAEQGQNIREGDAPRETDHASGDASRPDTEIHERASTNDKASSEAGPQAETSLAGTGSEMLADREARIEGQGASVALPTYAEPGVVVIEHTPPVGIVAHPYIIAWPLRELTLADGEEIREPIVKVNHFIVDGRQRYFAARSKGIEYPVVQYAGDDLLLDVIRLNLASRTMSEAALRMVAQKLAKLEPSRADEIMALMGMPQEAAA